MATLARVSPPIFAPDAVISLIESAIAGEIALIGPIAESAPGDDEVAIVIHGDGGIFLIAGYGGIYGKLAAEYGYKLGIPSIVGDNRPVRSKGTIDALISQPLPILFISLIRDGH